LLMFVALMKATARTSAVQGASNVETSAARPDTG
jgi:hypothetical protein